jgi:hypothetical protein
MGKLKFLPLPIPMAADGEKVVSDAIFYFYLFSGKGGAELR